MSQRQSVCKLTGNEKSRTNQRDREPNSLRQILDNEEQATQNNRNQGTAKHKNWGGPLQRQRFLARFSAVANWVLCILVIGGNCDSCLLAAAC